MVQLFAPNKPHILPVTFSFQFFPVVLTVGCLLSTENCPLVFLITFAGRLGFFDELFGLFFGNIFWID